MNLLSIVAIPDEYIHALRVLQDRAPARSFDSVKEVLREELGLAQHVPLIGEARDGAVFSRLEEEPIGSASLAQVHIGTLTGSAKNVAVKVQHRGLREVIQSDIRLLSRLNRLSQRIFRQDAPDLSWAIHSLHKNLLAESDFQEEAANLSRLGQSLNAVTPEVSKVVALPAVVKDKSSSKVLMMTFMDGIPIYDTQRLEDEGVNLTQVGQAVLECWAAMVS